MQKHFIRFVLVPKSQVQNLYSNKSNKENKKPIEKPKKEESNQKKNSKKEKSYEPTKPKHPKSIESALNAVRRECLCYSFHHLLLFRLTKRNLKTFLIQAKTIFLIRQLYG